MQEIPKAKIQIAQAKIIIFFYAYSLYNDIFHNRILLKNIFSISTDQDIVFNPHREQM